MFKYHNENPNGYKIPDCVVRAITLALNIPYYEVVTLLHINGDFYQCDCLSVQCYEKLLDFDFNLPHYLGNDRTVEEIANDFPNDTLILRMNGHLTCSINSVIYDLFDCSQESVTEFWIIK